MRAWWTIGLFVVAALGSCAHKPKTDDTRYLTRPLCDNGQRKSSFSPLRAGFGNEYSVNELEALTDLEQQYQTYSALEVVYPTQNTEEQQQRFEQTLGRKAAALQTLVQNFEPYMTAANEEIASMALYRIGEAHEQYAIDIGNLRVPAGLDEKAKLQFCSELAQRAQPIWDAANGAYKKCATTVGKDKNVWREACQKKVKK
jgi:hypothetical protein